MNRVKDLLSALEENSNASMGLGIFIFIALFMTLLWMEDVYFAPPPVNPAAIEACATACGDNGVLKVTSESCICRL